MRPISPGFDPYGHYDYPARRAPGSSRSVSQGQSRSVAPADVPAARQAVHAVQVVGDASPAADVEISIRMFADGGSISVRRHTVLEADGSRRTVGIEALIR